MIQQGHMVRDSAHSDRVYLKEFAHDNVKD